MILYRSIGEKELKALLDEQLIYGQYNCDSEKQNNGKTKNACCFFVDEVRWKDSKHRFVIVVDIPKEQLDFGIGDYYAGKSLKDSKIWSGKNGSLHYKIREAYTLSYSIKNVKEIFLFGSYASWFVEKHVEPICKKYNIIFHHMDKTQPFQNSSQMFIRVPYSEYKCDYVTDDYSNDWVNSIKIDESKYVQAIREKVLEKNMTLEQARQIAIILDIK